MSSHPSSPCFKKAINALYRDSHSSRVSAYRAKYSFTSRAWFLTSSADEYFSPSSSRMSTTTWVFVFAGAMMAFRLFRSPRFFSTRKAPYAFQMSVPLMSTLPPSIASIAIAFNPLFHFHSVAYHFLYVLLYLAQMLRAVARVLLYPPQAVHSSAHLRTYVLHLLVHARQVHRTRRP